MTPIHASAAAPTGPLEGGSRSHAGARWWSLDIHAHSPASFDYGGLEGNLNSDSKPSFEEWIQSYISAGVDGIVVTDHNTHEGVALARQALADLRSKNSELPAFAIFPGVEITAAGGVHVLGIFDPSMEAEVVNRTLVLCKYSGTRGMSDDTANMTVSDVAAVVAGEGGICVPAHADKNRGVFGMDQRDLTALGMSPHIVAVEVVEDDAVDTARKLGWVSVLGSDAHHLTTTDCPDGLTAKAPGTHLTYIKAGSLNLEGLRLALTDARDSVRRARAGDIDPNKTSHGHLDQLVVAHNGAHEVYRFGPWMNCLIGGRGVGKSTLIELLRLALGRTHELRGPLAEDLKRFDPAAEPDSRWWNDETQIVVDYTKDGRPLRITWRGSDPDRSRIDLWTGTEWQEQSGKALDRAPVRTFSQKQIYQLASSPQSFLTILDDMPSIRRTEWEQEHEELALRLKGERNQLRQLLVESDKADRIRGQLEEIRGRLSHLEVLRASSEYQELDVIETQLRATSSVEARAHEIEQSLTIDARHLLELCPDPVSSGAYADRAASLVMAARLISQAAKILTSARDAWTAGSDIAEWNLRITQLNEWLSEQNGPSELSADQTRLDREREAELEAELQSMESSDARVEHQQAVIDQTLVDIARKRQELHERRRQFTSVLNNADQALTKVEVFHQGDIQDLGAQLRILLRCPESFDSAFDQTGLGAALSAGQPKNPSFPAKVEEFKSDLIELVNVGAESPLAQSVRIDARFWSRLGATDVFDLITDIMLWSPDDLVSVRYRPRPGANLVSVDRGSPGQKTAALLTVILRMGADPLLLDQPEDDLENKLIRHLAVETLKEIKNGRQLLISTHNANVVVTSGAENILVLEHGEHIPAIESEGTLQVTAVKENVCEILEGGADAISTRYRRLIGSPGSKRTGNAD